MSRILLEGWIISRSLMLPGLVININTFNETARPIISLDKAWGYKTSSDVLSEIAMRTKRVSRSLGGPWALEQNGQHLSLRWYSIACGK